MQQNHHKNFKSHILTQNLFTDLRKTLHSHKIKLRWLLVILFLPIFAVLAAFSPNPSAISNQLKVKTVVQEVALTPATGQLSSNQLFWHIDQVRHKDTLGSLFNRMSVKDEKASKFLMLSPEASVINTQLIPGHNIEAKTNIAGELLHLKYELDAENALVVNQAADSYTVTTEKLVMQNTQVLKSATIINSLFGATDDADIPDQIALQIAEIFSSEIDFYHDLRSGDHFSVVYEAFYHAGELMKVGNVLAVEFVNNGKTFRAIHFGDSKGKFAYYTPEGKSLHKSFLRAPLEFTRISSRFSTGRYHPVLHRVRAHKGVDFAAPTGTRVKASGDGVVDFVGRKGGYGNVVVLKHKNGISTVYGHLSRFAKGLRKKMKVAQGDIIGYVGMSGLATGPHLHYEFLVNKAHRDPMSVALPVSMPIDRQYKKAFDAQSSNLMAQIEMLNRRQIASTD